MLFNSLDFGIWFIVVYVLYLFLSLRNQNYLLLVVSYLFYAYWDWRFLGLLILTTLISFYCSTRINSSQSSSRKKQYLLINIAINLGILGVFKYFNFFIVSLSHFLSSLDISLDLGTLQIILPLGISFYTFQAMSYPIDLYLKRAPPINNLSMFALYVAFFPQLIAGPIEKVNELVPQFEKPRLITRTHLYEGTYFIFWGLYKKIFVADNIAILVDYIFANYQTLSGVFVLLGIYAFSVQLYCDFSGYSDIAKGLGRLMGFDLTLNFNLPFFSTNIAEFWQKWHISLNRWLRDYVFYPLFIWSKNVYLSVFITFFCMGIWHGASVNFFLLGIFWGVLFATYAYIRPILVRHLRFKSSSTSMLITSLKIFCTYHWLAMGFLLFRAQSFDQICHMTRNLFLDFKLDSNWGLLFTMLEDLCFFTWFLLLVEFFQFRNNNILAIFSLPIVVRVIFYFICYFSIVVFGVHGSKAFIYFTF